MRYVTVSTDVDVYLDEIDTDDLVEELESRGIDIDLPVGVHSMRQVLSEIFELKRNGKDFSRQLDELIYTGIGRFA
jgi:hypothetical protein